MARSSSQYVSGFTPVGHSDQGGRPDGLQLQYWRDHVYVGHVVSGGFSTIDVSDPSAPRPVHFEPAPPNTWNIHLQAADDLLLVVHARDDSRDAPPRTGVLGASSVATRRGKEAVWSAGVAIYDVSVPGAPRRLSFLPVDGSGVHRIWYTGGRYAYASVAWNGFTDHILGVFDLQDPSRPEWVGRYWLPGMHIAAGERPTWDESAWRYGLHHAIVSGRMAYASWRDGGLTLLDVSERDAPALVARHNWSPPYGGGTHTALPLPLRNLLVVADESPADDLAEDTPHVWIFDIREPSNPISIATFPVPDEAEYGRMGGHFGPRNLHENRPGSFVSEDVIFATYQVAGLRVFNIADAYRPKQIGAFVPTLGSAVPGAPPAGRPLRTTDVFVRSDGLAFTTDEHRGLDIVQFNGL